MSPSIAAQAKAKGFTVDFYDFRKAKVDGIDFFNPAIVRRDDGLWLVTRRSEIRPGLKYGFNELMAFACDANHLPQYGKPVTIERMAGGEHFEDPRAFFHKGRWWLSACNFIIFPGNRTWTGAHQIVLEIDDEWKATRRRDPVYGKNSDNLFEQKGDEKNWLWFSHENELYLIYTTWPHLIVHWNDLFLPVEEYRTNVWSPFWNWGEPRGGSAPILVGDEYVSFFHSSTPWQDGKRQYHMGAYAFEARPPFRVTRVTPEPLLSGSLDDPWAEGKPLVVFPCAALYEKNDPHGYQGRSLHGEWTVSLGVNDLVSARATIPDWLLQERLSSEVTRIEEQKKRLSEAEIVYG